MSDKTKFYARMDRLIADDEAGVDLDEIPPDPPMCQIEGCAGFADVMLRPERHGEAEFYCWDHAPEEIRAKSKPLPWRSEEEVEAEVIAGLV